MTRSDLAFVGLRLIAVFIAVQSAPSVVFRLVMYVKMVVEHNQHLTTNGHFEFNWDQFAVFEVLPVLVSTLLAAYIWMRAGKMAQCLLKDHRSE